MPHAFTSSPPNRVKAKMTTIELFAGRKASGEAVYEQIPVQELADDELQVLASPGLVLGLAKGDVIKLCKSSVCDHFIVRRGGNLCIQLFCKRQVSSDCGDLLAALKEIGAELDGRSDKQLVFTVPVQVGFEKVQAVLNGIVRDYPDYKWYYGNVYDPRDGVTPLNWWVGTL